MRDNISTILKEKIRDELKTLPEQLDKLTAKERLEILTKLIPYVIAKPDTIKPKETESNIWEL